MLELLAMAGVGAVLGLLARMAIKGTAVAPWFVAVLLGVAACAGGAWLAGRVVSGRPAMMGAGAALGVLVELIYVPLANRGK